jgi:hypothetical protein
VPLDDEPGAPPPTNGAHRWLNISVVLSTRLLEIPVGVILWSFHLRRLSSAWDEQPRSGQLTQLLAAQSSADVHLQLSRLRAGTEPQPPSAFGLRPRSHHHAER